MSKSETGQVHTPLFGKVMLALLHDLTITDGAKVLFAHMHYRYGYGKREDNHEGQKSMAAALGVTEKTIRNRIDELEANDWIVTIYTEHDTKGNWQRCHYHIFETQDECRKFRAEYKPADKEELKAKPESRERVSRKGKGNTEAVPPPPPRRKSGSTATDGNQVPLVDGNQVPSDVGTQVPNIQNQSIQNQPIQTQKSVAVPLLLPRHMINFEAETNNRTHTWVKRYEGLLGQPYSASRAEMKQILEKQQTYSEEVFAEYAALRIADKPGCKLLFILQDLPNHVAAQKKAPPPKVAAKGSPAPRPSTRQPFTLATEQEADDAQSIASNQ